MAVLSDYTAGTVTVAANGTTVTGSGTAWKTAGFQEGDWFIAAGFVGIVASVASNTSLTLVAPWKGGALLGSAYRLRYMSDGSRASAQARELINLLGGGSVQAIAALTLAADKLPYATGAGTMALTDLTAFARTLLDDANPAAARTTLGLPATFGALAAKDKASLTADVSGVLPIANGGTGASTAAAARTALGALGAGATAVDSAKLAGVTPSAFVKTILDDADAAAVLSTLGIPYQTGTFTPGISFGGASTGIAYGAQTNGAYVRIGSLVYMTGWIVITNKGSSTGQALITDLPFSRAGNDYASPSFGRGSGFTGIAGSIAGYSITNTIILTLNTSNGFGGTVTDAHFTNTTQLFFSHVMSIN